MANWKKVVVSGSAAELSTLKVDNLASGVVTGSGSTLGTQAINGTGNILATTGATGISASGSFSGSFHGDGTNLTGVVASAPNSLHFEGGLAGVDYNGSTAVTASISGAASLSSNTVTKWTGTGFANSNITDNGTLVNVLSNTKITGSLDILLTGSSTLEIAGNNFQQTYISTAGALVLNPGSGGVGMAGVNQYITLGYIQGQTAGSYLTGSFTGSFKGDGSGLTGIVTASYANNASTADSATTAATASFVTGSNVVGTVASATSASYANNATTASYANNATTASYALNAGAGNGTFSGSFSGSFQGDGSALTGIAATLSVSGDSGSGTVDLKTQTLSVIGTANEVNTSVSGQTVTVGLPNNVTIAATLTAATASIQENLLVQGNTTLQGDLTVNGTTTFINTTNLYIEDKFALFASGSTTATDGGFVIQSAAAGTGYAFGYDASADRWALEDNVSGSATAFSGTPTAYLTSTEYGLAASIPANPSYGGSAAGYGNIWVSTDTSDIWIYA